MRERISRALSRLSAARRIRVSVVDPSPRILEPRKTSVPYSLALLELTELKRFKRLRTGEGVRRVE